MGPPGRSARPGRAFPIPCDRSRMRSLREKPCPTRRERFTNGLRTARYKGLSYKPEAQASGWSLGMHSLALWQLVGCPHPVVT